MNTPSPEQIAQWRKDAEKPYHDEYGIDNDARTKHAYTLGYLRARTEQVAEIAELKDNLQFVERWAVHHGTKSHMTPENALSVIQHYPAITAITNSYADGKVPATFNPYTQISELKAQRDIALSMLAAWCVSVDENGAGWDDWDEPYKDAMYRPSPIRELLDTHIASEREQRKD
jgi:acyl-CoA synthetase (AMP-forming)/AMP-acid ligase II